MLVLVALTAALWTLHLYARVVPTSAVIGAWVLLAAGLGMALTSQARLRRRGWLLVYLRPGAGLFFRLRGGVLMGLVQGLLGAGLALLFLIAIMRSTDSFVWIALLAIAVLLPPLSALLRKALRTQANEGYLGELAWRTVSTLLGVIVLAVLAWRALQLSYPDFGDVTLEQAVWHLVGQQNARSDWALTMLQVAAAGDGLRLWLGQQLLPTPGTSLWQSLGWAVLLAQEAVFVWSYLLLCRALVLPAPKNNEAP